MSRARLHLDRLPVSDAAAMPTADRAQGFVALDVGLGRAGMAFDRHRPELEVHPGPADPAAERAVAVRGNFRCGWQRETDRAAMARALMHRLEPCLICGVGAPCILTLFTRKDRDGTVQEEARRQENHFCQASQKDGKRQKAPQVRRHPAPESGGSDFDASSVLTARAGRSRQAASAWSLARGTSEPAGTRTAGVAAQRPAPASGSSPCRSARCPRRRESVRPTAGPSYFPDDL